MKMKSIEFTELHAKEICNWVYEDTYAIYNYPKWNEAYDEKESVLIGVGLKPSLCGQGLGKILMEIVKDKCSSLYPNKKIILEVRSFNIRAITCYESAGFKVKEIYNKNTPIGYGEFIKMELSDL